MYDVSKQTISQHIQRIYDDDELVREATVKKYLTVQNEGGRQIGVKCEQFGLEPDGQREFTFERTVTDMAGVTCE